MEDATLAFDPGGHVGGGAALAVSDRAADERDAAALVRDKAADARDATSAGSGGAQQSAGDRMLAAGDRAAAALDRRAAALDRRGAADYLQHAYRDDLTGTLRRDVGRQQLSQAVDRAHRTGQQLVIAYLDIDHLKQVNDALGHASGDRLLRQVGSALRQGLRSYDVVVRYGGDEFVCALQDSRLPEADRRLGDVAKVLSRAIVGASISVGLAELRREESLDEVIGRADREMYERRRTRRTGLARATNPSDRNRNNLSRTARKFGRRRSRPR